jgi:hypothetical protein
MTTTRVVIDSSFCGNNPITETERNTIAQLERLYNGMLYGVDFLPAHEGPKQASAPTGCV